MTVRWITPRIERGSARWPACMAEISSEEARAYRKKNGEPTACALRAKVNYDGDLLCVRHAQARALAEAMNV